MSTEIARPWDVHSKYMKHWATKITYIFSVQVVIILLLFCFYFLLTDLHCLPLVVIMLSDNCEKCWVAQQNNQNKAINVPEDIVSVPNLSLYWSRWKEIYPASLVCGKHLSFSRRKDGRKERKLTLTKNWPCAFSVSSHLILQRILQEKSYYSCVCRWVHWDPEIKWLA